MQVFSYRNITLCWKELLITSTTIDKYIINMVHRYLLAQAAYSTFAITSNKLTVKVCNWSLRMSRAISCAVY